MEKTMHKRAQNFTHQNGVCSSASLFGANLFNIKYQYINERLSTIVREGRRSFGPK